MNSKNKKILYFASSKGIGFTSHLSDLAINKTLYHKFIFISGEKCQTPGAFEKLDALKVSRETIQTLDHSKKIIKHLTRFSAITKKHSPVIVHAQTNYQLLLASILKPYFGYKIIQTIHAFNNGKKGIKMALTKAYLNVMCKIFADKIIFQSKYVEDNFASLKYKSCRLPMGYEGPGKCQPKSLSQPIAIIYAAKFHAAKNHKWLIENLASHLEVNNWLLILPGDGAELDNIRNLVNDKALTDRVHLPGWVNREDIEELYQAAQIAVVPSNSETLGHNIIEPLSYGIPVISFPVGIAPDIANSSPVVTCVPFYNADALLEAIHNTIKSPDDYSKRSGDALSYFSSHLTWEAHIKQYEKIIDEL